MRNAPRPQNFLSTVSALLLCLMLLCTQGAILHVHYFECGEGTPPDLTNSYADHGHTEHAKIHLATNDSHHQHAKAGMSELEISPQGLLTKIAGIGNLLLALICIFILLLPSLSRVVEQRLRDNCFVFQQRFAISPPLRAPPLG